MWPCILPAENKVYCTSCKSFFAIPIDFLRLLEPFLPGKHFVGQRQRRKCALFDDHTEEPPFLVHNSLDGLYSALNCLVNG